MSFRWSFPVRVAAALAAAGSAVLLCAPAAAAHSVLISSSPAKDAAVTASPAEVVLEFNEPVENRFTELAVLGPDGASHWEGGPVSVVDGRVSAPLRPLGPAGGYTIRYRVTSGDGHPVSGAIPFRLTVAGPATAAAAATMAASPAVDTSVPWWPWVTGGAVLLGTGFAVARRVARANT
ncbi:methionine-rich copper-binding protein CopC [Amycolatopsis lexingtonensis]|uniref:Methionine-rich copper-binding protein CopC n=1 Tax=Amycolatopsis lexingtonensis TaxID=218822 RepID=A0ABR9HS42_9PSEU|nr:copper resistance CopC family protein [Amycolatopsis lexingtonensis]MBE1493736.1 methionine-rich copper-binding protein CopC [Amycolatopsis lexingtonensis]